LLLCTQVDANAQADPGQVTWEFFEACGTGKISKAWEMTAPAVRKRKDISMLKAAIEKLGLTPSTFWTWKTEAAKSPYANVTGKTVYADGTKSQIRVNLIDSKGTWMVYSIASQALKARDIDKEWAENGLLGPLDSLADGLDLELPSNSDVQKEFRRRADELDSMMKLPEFNATYEQSRKPDPGGVYASIAEVAFRFKDRGVNLAKAPRSEWKTPFKREINEDANLLVSSTCEIAGHRLDMVQKFYLADNRWEQWAFHMDLLPHSGEVKSIVRGVLDRFNEAVQRRSFSEFHKSISARWRRDVTVEQMDNAFHGFWDKNVRLPTSSEIILIQEPKLTDDQISEFNGYLDLTEYRAWFHMKIIYENPEWKLFGLDLALKHPEASPPDFVKMEK
jgi:hypothetical protein